jgi:surface protein
MKETHEYLMKNDVKYKERFLYFMEDIKKNKNNPEFKSNAKATYVIPVVVHIIYNGDSDPIKNLSIDNVNIAINELNLSYSGTGIQFCLANRDPYGNTTNGVNMVDGKDISTNYNGLVYMNEHKGACGGVSDYMIKSATLWPEKDYYNMWAVSAVCVDKKSNSDTTTRGYAWFPWSSLEYGPSLIHGAVVDIDFSFKNPTDAKSIFVLAHETGHYLGLFHTFQGVWKWEILPGIGFNQCPENDDCEFDGDRICDTPPHKINDCDNTSCFNGNWDNSKNNYMNYCTDVDREDRLFTPEQIGRMKYWTIANESPRKSLLSSLGCIPPALPDLTISNSSVSPTSVDPGGNVTVTFKVNNIGSKAASANYTSFHLSSNTLLTPGQNGDTYLDEYYISQTISANGSTGTLTKLIKIPANTIPGTYYVFFSADGAENVTESDEKNNFTYVVITVKGVIQNCTPSTPSGLSNSVSQYSASLSWSSVTGVQKYNVRFRASSGNWTTISTGGASASLSSLSCNTSYEWQVQAECSGGNSGSYSSSKNFTTSSCGTINCPPQNDNCSSATTITSNGTCIQGGVRCATTSYGANDCGNGESPDDNDVYYKFTAKATSHKVTVSDYANNFDAVIELRRACAFGSANFISCYDPVGKPSTVSYTWSNLSIGTTYYIRIYEYNSTGTPPSSYEFNICLTHQEQATDCVITNLFDATEYFNADGGDNSDNTLVITASQAYCNYSVTKGSGCSFVDIDNPTGTTNQVKQAQILYSVDRNASYDERRCILTVGSRTQTIIQRGCDPYFSTEAKSVKSAGENYTISVENVESFCSWNFSQNNCSWVSFSRTSGSGERDIDVEVSPNTNTSPRTCRITLNNGETHVINQQGVVCGNAPFVNIISSTGNNTICQGESVRLTAYVQNCTDCTYNWNTGATNTSININSSGSYSVTVTNVCGSASDEINVSSSTLPSTPANIIGESTVCEGQLEPYSVPAVSGAIGYLWTYSNGEEIYNTERSISFSPSTSGTLSVKAINDCGESTESTLAIAVNPLPASLGEITASNTSACSGQAITYSVPAVSGLTYVWSYSGEGNPVGTENSISFNPISSGILSVSGINDCGESDSSILSVTINNIPPTPDEITGEVIVCSGLTNIYSVPAITGVTYEWEYSGVGTIIGTGRSISLMPTTSGTLSVILVNDCGNSVAKTLAINVVASAPATPGDISGGETICSGVTKTFSIESVFGASTYTWSYSGTGVINENETSVNLTATTNGILSVIAKNNCGESSSRTIVITVIAKPDVPDKITGEESVCSGLSKTYSIPAITGLTYEWSYSGIGTLDEMGNNISLIPQTTGILSVTIKSLCDSIGVLTKTIQVINLEKPQISLSGSSSICQGDSLTLTSSIADSYLWSTGDTTQSIVVNEAGNYTVTVSEGSCSERSDSVSVEIIECRRPFVTIWKTDNPGSSNDNQITIPGYSNGEYDIYWEEVENTSNKGSMKGNYSTTITFPFAGTYRVSISNIESGFNRIAFYNSGDRLKLLDIEQWGNIEWSSFEYAFYGCENLTVSAKDVPILNNVTNMYFMFTNARSFNQPIGNWDVSKVKDITYMFYGAKLFNQPIGNWDVSNVTNMSGVFYGATSFNQPIGDWDVSKVIDLSYIFSGASSFNRTIGNWDVSNVIDMSGMFYGATSFNQPIGDWDVSNVTNMLFMFDNASFFNQPIETWNVSNVEVMNSMFSSAISFNQPIRNWNVSKVKDMGFMFFQASSFNQPIEDWDVHSVTNMTMMFAYDSSFNQPIGNWNVGSVTNMSAMFSHANSFNQHLEDWDVSNVVDLGYMFRLANSFNQPIENWNVKNVKDLSHMFYYANSFNQTISNWDVSNVKDMSYMFYAAESYNQPIGNWKLNSDLEMNEMFSFSDLQCENYTKTLTGWANNPATPDSLELGASNLYYGNNAIASRNVLISKGWTIEDAGLDEDCESLVTGIDEKEYGIELFHIYPNPNDGYFTIEVESQKGGGAVLEIVNALGQVIKTQEIQNLNGNRIIQADLSDMSKGIYFVKLHFNNETINRRVVIQ